MKASKHKGIRPMIVVDGEAVFYDEHMKSRPYFHVTVKHYHGGGWTSRGGPSLADARAQAMSEMQAPWHQGPMAVVRNRRDEVLDIIGPWEAWPIPRCMHGFGGMTEEWVAERKRVAIELASLLDKDAREYWKDLPHSEWEMVHEHAPAHLKIAHT